MSGPDKIMLIRHAEKPFSSSSGSPGGVDESGSPDPHSLTVRGWQRAGALVTFFGSPTRAGITTPATIVASAEVTSDDEEKSRRPAETVRPLHARLGCPFSNDVPVGSEDILIQRLALLSGAVLVAWEHKRLHHIVAGFIADLAPEWDGGRFDVSTASNKPGFEIADTEAHQVASESAPRRTFLIAAALIAAALADPVVESIANTGVLGGHYADNNHLSVVPALLAGVILAFGVLARRCLVLLHSPRASRDSYDWLVDAARAFTKRDPAKDLPAVFVLQLIALYTMESAEQLALGGRLLGGTAWLGGPVLFSLLFHALIGAGCLFALGSFMRALLRTFAALVRTVVRCVWLAHARTAGSFARTGVDTRCLRSQTARVRQIGGRAPPLLPTPA